MIKRVNQHKSLSRILEGDVKNSNKSSCSKLVDIDRKIYPRQCFWEITTADIECTG